MACRRILLLALQIVILLFNFLSFGCADNVPAFIWGQNSRPDLLPSTSALGTISSKDFKEIYLKSFVKYEPLVVFVQDKLSLEDATRKPSSLPDLENVINSKPSIVLTSVENPVSSLESMKSQTIDSSKLNAKSLEKVLKNKPQVLLILLPLTEGATDRRQALLENDELVEELSKLFDPKLTMMFTGKTSSWDSKGENDVHHRIARQLQATADEPVDGFVNVSGSLFWYAEKIVIETGNSDFNGTYKKPDFQISTNSSNSSMVVLFTFERVAPPVVKAVLELSIESTFNHWWYISYATLQLGNEEEIRMDASTIGASAGFSYSCGNTLLKVFNSTTDNVTMELQQFQLEFKPRHEKFSESFSCYTFFTIPIWMGLFVVILFTVILAVGVYLLFEVRTMDRFDDPKGKSISVPLTD